MKDEIRPSACIIAIPLVLLITAAILFKLYIPELSCPIKSQTGLDCPGCGGTGASQKLISGDLVGAFKLNALTTGGIITLITFCIWSSIQKIRSGKYSVAPINLKTGCMLLTIIVVFTLYRNI